MDPPCKRPRTASSEDSHFVDRLSNLPIEVLFLILSFVDFVDIVRTSVLSKQWRIIWTSVPYLNFNINRFIKHYHHNRFNLVEPQFWDFVRWALLLRDGSRIIRMNLHAQSALMEQLNGLLRVASKHKVQELCFVYGDHAFQKLQFPRALCETLVVLTLSSCEKIELQLTTNFSSLRSLNLTRVCISRGVVEKLFSTNCVKLENVYLEDCQAESSERINISASNLKSLTIVNLSTSGKFWVVGGFGSQLRITASKLESFCYVGPMLHRFALLNTISLKNASIRLLRIPQADKDEDPNYIFCPSRFIGFNHAKTLTLSTLVVKYFCPPTSDLSWDTFILDKLNHVELELRYNANHIEGLINLLKLSPNLEGLVIRFKVRIRRPCSQQNRRNVIENRSSWKSREERIACLSNHVKIIQISNSNDTEIALELVKFFLQNGKALEKMEIVHGGGKRRSKSFNKKLIALPKASSKVIINFPQHAQRKIPWFDKGESDSEFGN